MAGSARAKPEIPESVVLGSRAVGPRAHPVCPERIERKARTEGAYASEY